MLTSYKNAMNPTLSKSGNYNTDQLFVTKMRDEDGNEAYEFKDKIGRVLLTRQMNGATGHGTYYVYDNFDNLVFVLPPLAADALTANATWSIESNTVLENYAYAYRYDHRNRCIYKKLPGADPVYYRYDKADRLIFSQDGEQRAENATLWAFSIPDVLGRIVLQGTCKVTSPDNIANTTAKAEYKENVASGNFRQYGYSVSGLPVMTDIKVLQVNYYDDYRFKRLSPFSAHSADFGYSTPAGFENKRYGTDADLISTKGLLTGSLTALLDYSNELLGSVFYYDKKARLIQAVVANHLGGYEKEYTNYSFTGLPTWKRLVHYTANYTYKKTSPLTQTYTYLYDHAGRLTETKLKVGNNSVVSLAKLDYNEIGQLTKKSIHGGKAAMNYTYNIRGWAKSINAPEFNQILYYNESYQGNTPRYNGNISAMMYTTGHSTFNNRFHYTYDGLNRLTESKYSSSTPLRRGLYNEEMTYNKMGGITQLKRYDFSPYSSAPRLIDDLAITYAGNQLKRVTEGRTGDPDEGFIAGSNITGDHYVYNKNGAMVQDPNKGITDIEYNPLNLPQMIVFA